MRINPLPKHRIDAHVASVEQKTDHVLRQALQEVLGHLQKMSQLGADDLSMLTSIWRQQINDVLMPLIVDTYREGARHLYNQATKGLTAASDADQPDTESNVSTSFLVSPILAEQYFASAINRLTRVSDTVWDEARNQLIEGTQQGESIEQLSDRITGVHGISEGRAKVIARTEVLTAARGGAYDEIFTLGLSGTHEWLATHDKRTRETHALASGQVQPITQPFIVGGYPLKYPGDPNGPAEEIVQCRCDSAYNLV